MDVCDNIVGLTRLAVVEYRVFSNSKAPILRVVVLPGREQTGSHKSIWLPSDQRLECETLERQHAVVIGDLCRKAEVDILQRYSEDGVCHVV